MDALEETVILSKSEKTNIIYHLHVESKKRVQMKLFIKHKQNHRCRKQTYGCQGMGEEG